MQENCCNNLRSGFRKCSIYPIDIEELLKGIRKPCDSAAIEKSFENYLDQKTEKLFGTNNNKQRRKKVNVPPGRSITLKDVQTGSQTPADLPDSEREDDPPLIHNMSDDDTPISRLSSTPVIEKNSAVPSVIEKNSSITSVIESTSATSSEKSTQVIAETKE